MTETKSTGRVSGFIRYTLNISSKQLWLLVMWCVILLFVYPITMSITAGSYYYAYLRTEHTFIDNTAVLWCLLPVAAFVFSHGFGYLNSRSKLDFYHSQPVTRTKLFAANYLNGLLLFLIPLAVMMPAGLVAGFTSVKSLQGGIHFHNQYGVELSPPQSVDFSLFYFALLYTFLLFFVFYSLAVLCRMLCGNTVIAMLVFCFIYVLPTLLDLVVDFYFDRFSTLFVGTGSGSFFELFAPLRLIISLKDALEQAGGRISFALGGLLAAVCALGAVCLLLAAFLYRFRRSEKAGAAVAIRGVVPVVKYPLVTVMILFAGFVFFNLSNGSLFWEISGYVLFGLLAFMLVNVLEKFDFRNILASLWKSVFCFAAAALFVGGTYVCAARYDSIPDAEDVSEVVFDHIYISGPDIFVSLYPGSGNTVTDREVLAETLEVLRDQHLESPVFAPRYANAQEFGTYAENLACLNDGESDTFFALSINCFGGDDGYRALEFLADGSDSEALARLFASSGLITDMADPEDIMGSYIRMSVWKDNRERLFSVTMTRRLAYALADEISFGGAGSGGSDIWIRLESDCGVICVRIREGGALEKILKENHTLR